MTDEVMTNLERLNTERVAKQTKDPRDEFGFGRIDAEKTEILGKILDRVEDRDVERREDHALALLLSLTGSGLIQWASPADLDELARDCVRTVRAIEAEAAEPTARRQPTPAERRPRSQRPAGPEAEEGLGLGPVGAEGGLYDDAEEGERW